MRARCTCSDERRKANIIVNQSERVKAKSSQTATNTQSEQENETESTLANYAFDRVVSAV